MNSSFQPDLLDKSDGEGKANKMVNAERGKSGQKAS